MGALEQRWSRGRRLPFEHDGYRITCARIGDLPRIARIEAAVFPEPLALSQLVRLWFTPRTRYVVARHGRELAGYFGFQVSGPTAHVIANATHPAHRRHGLASILLTAGEGLARPLGARWFLGEVRRSNAAQLSVLAGIDWRPVGTCGGFFGNGEDAHVVFYCFTPAAWQAAPDG